MKAWRFDRDGITGFLNRGRLCGAPVVAAMLILGTGPIPRAVAAPFMNGGFEDPSDPGPTAHPPGNTAITAWVVGGTGGPLQRASGEVIGGLLRPYEGYYSLWFGGGQAPIGTSISQTFDTAVGTNYFVSFAIGKLGTDVPVVRLRAVVKASGGSTNAAFVVTRTNEGWAAVTGFFFTATSAQSTLAFTDESDSTINVDAALDSVSVTITNLPLTWTDIGAFLGMEIQGTPGLRYRIDYVDAMGDTNAWTALTTIVLPLTPYLFLDRTSDNASKRFYRAVLIP